MREEYSTIFGTHNIKLTHDFISVFESILFLITRIGIDIEAGCGQLTTELMKRRKKTPSAESESELDAESDLKIISLLSAGVDIGNALVEDGQEGEIETEEALDKSFLSLDVEKERQITFAEIENANR